MSLSRSRPGRARCERYQILVCAERQSQPDARAGQCSGRGLCGRRTEVRRHRLDRIGNVFPAARRPIAGDVFSALWRFTRFYTANHILVSWMVVPLPTPTVRDLARADLRVKEVEVRLGQHRRRIETFRVKGWDTEAAETILHDMLALLHRMKRHRNDVARAIERAQNSS